MTFLAQLMLVIFMLAWCAGAAAWAFSMRYFMPYWWAGIRGREKPRGYLLKAFFGGLAFAAAVGVGMAAGAVAEKVGGWG